MSAFITDEDAQVDSDYSVWTDQRLTECYKRNSRLLREEGYDRRTGRTLCAVEEELRRRDIDPERVIEGIWDDD